MTTLLAEAPLTQQDAAKLLRPAPERVALGTPEDVEILPGAVRSEIAQVLMRDLVGPYAATTDVLEWAWVQQEACFEHNKNGQDGAWEFFLNLREQLSNIPEKFKPVIRAAREQGIAYLLVSHTA